MTPLDPRFALALLLLPGCVGCRSKPDADRANPAPRVAEQRRSPRAVGDQETVVIWGRPRASSDDELKNRGGELTHFLRPDGALIETRAGAYLTAGKGIYRFQTQARRSTAEPCPLEPGRGFARTLEEASLQPADLGSALLLLPFADAKGPLELPVAEQHTLVASAGAFLFVKTARLGPACSQDMRYDDTFRVYELGPEGGLSSVGERPLLSEGTEEQRAEAAQLLNRQLPAGPRERAYLGGDLEPTMEFPLFTADGASWVVQYTAPASLENSNDYWGGRSRSVRITSRSAPKRLRAALALPAVALRYMSEHLDEDVRGVSVGELDRGPP